MVYQQCIYIINKTLSDIVSKDIKKMLEQAFEYADNENFHDALRLYDLALKEEPENIGALVDKGATLQNMGRIKLAIKTFDKALAISPKNLDALLNKGAALH